MSDLEKYINKRKLIDPIFAENFEEGYNNFKIGVILKEARVQAGITQEEIAEKMQTKKSAISRIENHSEDIRLSTLEKYAHALGLRLSVQLMDG